MPLHVRMYDPLKTEACVCFLETLHIERIYNPQMKHLLTNSTLDSTKNYSFGRDIVVVVGGAFPPLP